MFVIKWDDGLKIHECITADPQTVFQLYWDISQRFPKKEHDKKEFIEYYGTPWMQIYGNGGFYNPKDLHTPIPNNVDSHFSLLE